MKKLLLLILILVFVGLNVNAQTCNTGGCSIIGHAFPKNTLTPTTSWATSGGMNGGNWTYFSVTCGNTYDWTYCSSYGGASQAWDAQLTLYNYSTGSTGALLCYQDNSGLSACPNAPYLRWTATFDGTVQLLTTVASCNTNSNSPYSTLAYRIYTTGSCTPTCTTPGAPASVTGAQTGQTTANLSWSAGSPLGSSTVTYYWVIGTSSSVVYNSGVAQGSTTSTSTSVSGLSPGTTYYMKVFENTSCNNTSSSYGNIVSFTTTSTTICTTPGTPLNVTGTQTGQTTASLLWSAGSPVGSSSVTYYWVIGTSSSVVYGSGVAQGSTTGTSATVSGLTAGTTYYLKVFANTSCNNTSSSYGNTASFTTSSTTVCTTPGTPANAIGTPTGQTSANLSWSAGSPAGSSTVTYYWVVGTSSTVTYGNGVAQGTTTGTTATTTSLSCGTTYYLRVYAKTSCDGSSSSYKTSALFTTSACSASSILYGIDVSHYQGTINWSQVNTAQKAFAYIKATQGYTNDANDTYFSQNITPAINSGLKIGAYHVAMPANYSSSNEATHFLNTAGSYIGAGYLPPALDLESLFGLSTSVVAQWVNDWSTQIYSSKGVWPLLYIARCDAGSLYPYYQNGTINSNIKLWIADIDHSAGSPGNASICSSTPWVGWPWIFHQYSWTAVVAGITENFVDLDIFNGDETAFNNLIGTTPVTLACNNDNACSPKSLTINSSCISTSCSTVGATTEAIAFYGNSGTAYQSGRYDDDVWFTITPTNTKPIVITVTPTSNTSNFDIVVGVYSGSCSSLTQVSSADVNSVGVAEQLSFTPAAGTTYLIRVFGYGIGSTYSGNFDICACNNPATSIDEIKNEQIKIYPNPTTGKLEISEIETLGSKCKVEIFNYLGVSIYVSEEGNFGNKISLDLSPYPAGMYLIMLSNNEISYQKKVIKK